MPGNNPTLRIDMTMSRPSRQEEFGVALICALSIEFDAIALAFDDVWRGGHISKAPGDYNSYTLGRIGGHNVVLVLLHKMGKASAASATTSLRHSFPAITLAILCGVCGGVPNPTSGAEIMLGDIIISENVVQYDYGRQYPTKFVHKNTVNDTLSRPGKEIRSLLAHLKTDFGRDELQGQIPPTMKYIQRKTAEKGYSSKYARPAAETDVLFQADYLHKHRRQPEHNCCEDTTCDEATNASCTDLECEIRFCVSRRRPYSRYLQASGLGINPDTLESQPRVFIGTVASGDTVMKSGEHRDMMARKHDVIAFEMEGAGVWDEIACVIVKSVCDYADSHKHKQWQGFAAMSAASATQALLSMFNHDTTPALMASAPHKTEAQASSFIVPYNENPDFVGRLEILEEVQTVFGHAEDYYHRSGMKSRSRVALHGLGGVGKTQIALAYCYWFRNRFPDASVFWVHASNVERVHKAFSDIAQECEIPGRDDQGADILLLVKRWLENKRRGRWLLVIDNADDTEVFFPQSGHPQSVCQTTSIGHCIPESPRGSILITTRNKQAGMRLTRGKPPIKVERMTKTETTDLLRTLLDDESVTSTEASLLSSRLEHLPLALAQAASFILENDISIEDYVGLLGSDSSMVDRLSEPFETVGRDTETPHALTATWAISFKQIKKQKPMASDVLCLISLFDRQAVPKEFIRKYCSERLQEKMPSELDPDLDTSSELGFRVDVDLEVTQILGVLLAFSFVSKAGDNLYDMHRLVQLVTRQQLADKGKMSVFATDALKVVLRSFPEGGHESRVLCLQLLPHALAVLKRAEKHPTESLKEVARLSWKVGWYFRYRGQYTDSEQFTRRAVDLYSRIKGPEDNSTLAAMSDLTYLYVNLNRKDEALEIARRVLEVDERLRPENTQVILIHKSNLANVLAEVGKFGEAERLYMQVLAWRKEAMGEEDASTLRAMEGLVCVQYYTGRFDVVEQLCSRLVELTKKTRGEEHPTTLRRMLVLSKIYEAQKQYHKAEQLTSRATEARGRVLGETHPHTLHSLRGLSRLYSKLGRFEEDEKIRLRLLEVEQAMSTNGT